MFHSTRAWKSMKPSQAEESDRDTIDHARVEQRVKGCLEWDSFPTFLRLASDADAHVRKRQDSFASTQAI